VFPLKERRPSLDKSLGLQGIRGEHLAVGLAAQPTAAIRADRVVGKRTNVSV